MPQTKQIGYYSDMYKLEFALPKFNMYKRILAKILAERFVIDRGWSETRAIDLGLARSARQHAADLWLVRGDAESRSPSVAPAFSVAAGWPRRLSLGSRANYFRRRMPRPTSQDEGGPGTDGRRKKTGPARTCPVDSLSLRRP